MPIAFGLSFPAHATADPATYLAELKLPAADGHPIRVPVEDWEAARQRVAVDKQWEQWLPRTRREIDAWMARHKDRVEWRNGWLHDFVSPKDGSALTWTEDIPGEDVQFLSSPSDPHVAITPKIKAGWISAFRRKHFDMMIQAAQLFRLTNETKYGEWAASQLDFYAENYEKWPTTKNGTAHIGWQSLEDATYLAQFAEVSRLLFDWAKPERRQMWFDKLLKPEVELLDNSMQSIHNIACWHRSSSAQVALVYGDEAMLKRQLDGPFGIRAQVRQGITVDYFWHEQSLGYNDYVVRALYPLFYTAGVTGKGHLLRNEAAKVQNLLLSPLLLRFPDGTLPNPADTVGKKTAVSTLLAATYRVFPTTLGLSQAAAVKDWNTLLDPPQPTAPPTLPPIISRKFEGSQFAVLKQGDWQLFLHYGQITRSHSQDEALNWSATYKGQDITHDPGTVRYGSPLYNGYYKRGLNHNIPLVNGEGQEPWKPGKLTAFEPEAGKMTAVQPKYRPDASAQRTLEIIGNKVIDRAEVTYTGTEPVGAKLGLVLHLQGKPRLPEAFIAVPNFAANRPEAFKYWQGVRAATFTDQAEFLVGYPENLTLRVRISAPGKFTIYQGSSPDYAPTRRAGFYIELENPGKQAVFITELSPEAG